MKMAMSAAALVLVSVAGSVQVMGQAEGVSRPDPVEITAQPDEAVVVRAAPAKPSAAVPATEVAVKPLAVRSGPAAGSSSAVYGPYVPYAGTESTVASKDGDGDVDGQIVVSVPEVEGVLNEGTLLHTRIDQPLSTVTTEVGSRFSAELTQPVMNLGRVMLPVGAVVEGRVTQVHGGRRISGAAMMHLVPTSVRLPDGTRYALRAQLIDTNQMARTKVDGEGSLVRRDHPKETLAVIGGVTGGAATAGALLGGGVGAAVGAGIGAGVGTVVWLKQDRQEALPRGAELVFSLMEPMDVRAGGDALLGVPRR